MPRGTLFTRPLIVRGGGVATQGGDDAFDVTAYGAKGDGVTDDTAAIQATITAAAAAGVNNGTTVPGGTVYAPAGEYQITGTIEIPTRVVLVGAGRMVTRILAGATFPTSTPLVHLGTTGSGFGSVIENLTVDANDVAGSVGIFADELEEFGMIRRVHVRNCRQYGIHIDAFTGGTVTQQFILDRIEVSLSTNADATSVGIYLQIHNSGRPSHIRDLSITRLAAGVGTALRLEGVSGVEISGVHLEQCQTDGILIGDVSPCLGLTIAGVEGNPASSLTNLVRISTAPVTKTRGVVLLGLRANASMTLLDDDINGYTITGTDLGYWMQGVPGNANETVWPVMPGQTSTPSALGAGDNNDYALASALVDLVRLQANAAGSTLTGVAGGVRRRRLRIINISANTLTIGHANAGSAAANQILSPTGANVALGQNDVADLEYDGGSTANWRIVNVAT